MPEWEKKLTALGVNVLKGRKRHKGDKDSIYFTDPDGHKFELHTGSVLDRLAYYQKEKPHLSFHEANIKALYEKTSKKAPRQGYAGSAFFMIASARLFINRHPSLSGDENSDGDDFPVLLKRKIVACVFRYGNQIAGI